MSQRTSNEQTLVERLRDCVKVTFSAGLHGVESDCREAADELDRQRAEIERLRDTERKFGALMHDVMDERDRLRAALELADQHFRVIYPRGADEGDHICKAVRDALSGDPSADETTSEWLTDKQCDDVIAFLEDYEWSGLTRENVRTWCTAIAEARSSVKASAEHAHTDECWEPDSGCDMGRNEAHAVAEERCEHGIPRRFCTAVHPSENPSICPYGQSDCETTRGGVCLCAMPSETRECQHKEVNPIADTHAAWCIECGAFYDGSQWIYPWRTQNGEGE